MTSIARFEPHNGLIAAPAWRSLRAPLRLLRQAGERGGARNRELRQALAIQRHAGVLQPADELAVVQPMLASGRVDADDPQAAKIPLLAAPADERILECGVDRLLRRPIELALVGVIAFRQAKQLLALGAADRSSFYSWHLLSLRVTCFLTLVHPRTSACVALSPYLYGSI